MLGADALVLGTTENLGYMSGARRAVEGIVTGLRWRAVREPLLCRGEWQETFLGDCEELGMLMAAGLEAGVF